MTISMPPLPIRGSPVTYLLLAPRLPTDPGPLLLRWLDLAKSAPDGSQLIVIDDQAGWHLASPSDLASPRLHLFHHPQPLGLGGCLQTGLSVVESPLVLIAPFDLQYSPCDTQRLFERIDGGHVVVAVRDAAPTPPPLRIIEGVLSLASRIVLGYVPNERVAWPGWDGWQRRRLARHIFGLPLADPLSTLMLARTEVVRGLPIRSNSPFAMVELLAKINHLGYLMDEVAVPWKTGPAEEFGSFSRDAWSVFSNPDFGKPRPSQAMS